MKKIQRCLEMVLFIDWWLIIFSYDEVIKIDPKYKDAWVNKGNVFKKA